MPVVLMDCGEVADCSRLTVPLRTIIQTDYSCTGSYQNNLCCWKSTIFSSKRRQWAFGERETEASYAASTHIFHNVM